MHESLIQFTGFLLSSILIVMSVCIRRVFLSPVLPVALVFSFTIGASTWLLTPSLISLLYLFSFISCFILFYAIGSISSLQVRVRPRSIANKLLYKNLLVGLGVMSGGGSVLFLIYFAVSAGAVDTFARFYSHGRYASGLSLPMPVRVANVVTYATAIIGLLIFNEETVLKSKHKIRFVLPALFLVIQAALLGMKAVVVVVTVYYLATLYAVICYHRVPISRTSFAIRLLSLFIAGLVIVICVQLLRMAGDRGIWYVLQLIFTSYLVLPTAAFMQWLSDSGVINLFNWNGGMHTLAGFWSHVVGAEQEHGEFVQFVWHDSVLQTNVYTLYRPLIVDFGTVGAWLVIIGSGFILGRSSRAIERGRSGAIGLYLAISALFLFSCFGPLYKQTTNLVVMLLVAGYFAACGGIARRKSW